MKSRLAVAVLTALLVLPHTAKAQMPSSDIAWMRTCSREREAFQAAMHRTYGADTLKAADVASKAEEGLYDTFKKKKSVDGQIEGENAAELRSFLAGVQNLVSDNMARLGPQEPPTYVTYTRCVLTDVADFAQAKIQARLDEIGKATQGSADYTPAPVPTYTPPVKTSVDPFPVDVGGEPVTPSGAPCKIVPLIKTGVMHGSKDFERYDFSLINQCQAPITLTIRYNGITEVRVLPRDSTVPWFCTVGLLGNTDCPGGKIDVSARWTR